MYINKPQVTNVEAADRVNLCTVLAAGLNSTNLENLVKRLARYAPLHDIHKTLAFRHRN